ncbi:hypothetical protein C0Q70_04586 [Pomacea canaliculata]|uniref:Uncharacterized protein n=1 Tax=Pomacea canaliculata TaxID=400727 RepID=A0A2T7PIY7_POMCA|nr:hypothetical protein C0Q70_04586 [Pomacea canaliculata]
MQAEGKQQGALQGSGNVAHMCAEKVRELGIDYSTPTVICNPSSEMQQSYRNCVLQISSTLQRQPPAHPTRRSTGR